MRGLTECIDVPGWFCLAHPLKCVAEGPERGDNAPKVCPKCGAQVGITVFESDVHSQDCSEPKP